MPPRNRVIMIKRERPKRVTLPDGRTFIARQRCATRDDLPPNISLPRVYKQRAAPKGKRRRNRRLIPYRERQGAALHQRAQRGRGIGYILKKGFKLGKRALNSRLGKRLARAAISEVPDVLEKLGRNVKNKRLKSILTSDLAKTGADYATGLALEKLEQITRQFQLITKMVFSQPVYNTQQRRAALAEFKRYIDNKRKQVKKRKRKRIKRNNLALRLHCVRIRRKRKRRH